ncbi:MAG: hypothetical protein QOH79_2289 [Acidimicrobiaceae bacterium]
MGSPPGNSKPFYTRWWVIALVVLLVLILIGAIAGGSSDKKKTAATSPTTSSTSSSSASEATTTSAPTTTVNPNAPHVVGETAHTGDFDVTLNEFIEPFEDSSGFFSAQPGNHLVAVDVTMHNTDKDSHTVSSLAQFTVVDPQSRSYQASFAGNQNRVDGTVAAGDQIRGVVSFEVPDGITGLVLKVKGDFTSGGTSFQLS